MSDKFVIITELQQAIDGLKKELESEEFKDAPRNVVEKFKVYSYKLVLQRYLSNLELLQKIEKKFNELIENETDISNLVNVYKSLIKGTDLLNVQLRSLFPSKLSEDYIEATTEIDNLINIENPDGKELKKIVLLQIKDILKALVRLRKDMDSFDNMSLEFWKAVNSYTELQSKLMEFVKILEKIRESEADAELELTMEEILKAYEEISELEEKEIEKIEEKWENQQSKVKGGLNVE